MKIGESTAQSSQACYHCGDQCDPSPVMWDSKAFCCEGCKSVYQVLSEADLCEYYNYRDSSGLEKKKDIHDTKYLYLEDEAVISKLLRFKEGDTALVQFYIPSIHCSACIWLLENLNRLDKAVGAVQVDFPKKEALITFDSGQISLKELVMLLASIGYEPLISLESSSKRKQGVSRTLYYRLGVAGFCFGNIMLLSFPEYLGAALYQEKYLRVFPYLNLLLSIPVLLYSSSIYLQSAYKGLRKGILNIDVPISLGILVLFARSVWEILSESGAGYMDSLSGLVFFLLIGRWYQERTYRSLSFDRTYASYFPMGVNAIKNGEEKGISLSDVEPGMRLRIRNNDLIPADCILAEGHARVDYSFVTGESDTISKTIGSLLYAGGRQKGGMIEVIVEKRPDQSYLTSLWGSDAKSGTHEDGVAAVADSVSRLFTIVIISIAAMAGIAWAFIDPSMIAMVVTSVLIVACPCALALSVPFAYGTALRTLAKKGIYLRASRSIEKFQHITDIIFDKTGTLTTSQNSSVTWHGKENDTYLMTCIASLAKCSSHPLSRSIASSLKADQLPVEAFREIAGAGISGKVKGLDIALGSASFVGADILANDHHTRVYCSVENQVIGFFEFVRPFRKDLDQAVYEMSEDKALHVVSGDSSRDAERIESIFGKETPVLFGQGPEDKLEYIHQLKKKGKKVCMLGDGLNDAPAIRLSDLGISVAEEVYHFTPASDVIIQADKISRLPALFRFSRHVKTIVQQSFFISIAYNTVGIGIALSGQLTPLIAAILMPLSSVTIVAFVSLRTLHKSKKLQ